MKTPKTIFVATSNEGKVRDFAALAEAHGVQVLSLPGFSRLKQVVEDGATFEANAIKKAVEYSRAAPGELVLADDSGLEVAALDGAPGVFSARYAGEGANDGANNAKLLLELEGRDDREARFVAVIAVARDGELLGTFRGEVSGAVTRAPRGAGGFGYDPLFLLPELGRTYAELSDAEKARHSHRARAFAKFLKSVGSY